MTDPTSTFSQLGLPDSICQTLAKLGYEQPSSIQQRAIGPLLDGQDLLGVAQTGTGKTAAFALPLLARLDAKSRGPKVLILTPTRELCIQVAEAIETYAESYPRIKTLAIYGGQDMRTQLRQLKAGAQVIVGTPGRVMDHMRRKSLDLSGLNSLVLDEADEMLRMGFIDDVEWILDQTPSDRQLALFSATMPAEIKRIASKYLSDPVEVRIESATKTVSSIEQFYLEVSNAKKLAALDLVLETETFDAVIVFVRTKISAQEIAQKLEARGYKASAIHGDLNQRQRELCIRQLKESVIDVVVATDVAARGIDVPRITHVVNYDIPYDGESYIHRVGRTGRAGRSGKAFLFVTPRERRMLKTIERTTGQPVSSMSLPTVDQLAQARLDLFTQKIKMTLEKERLHDLREVVKRIQTDSGLSFEDIALALTKMSSYGRPLVVTERDLPSAGTGNPRNDRNSKRRERGSDTRDSGGRGGRESVSGDSQRKTRSERASEREQIPMETYRLEVGSSHSVRVGDILGAVANELGIESRYIGNIQLEDESSSIELPEDMPKELFHVFKKLRIRNYQANPELVSKGKRSSNPSKNKSGKSSAPAGRGGNAKAGPPPKRGAKSKSANNSNNDFKDAKPRKPRKRRVKD